MNLSGMLFSYCVAFLFLFSASTNATPYEISLDELITKTGSFKPEDLQLSSITDLQKVLDNERIIPLRQQRNRRWINTLSQYQVAQGLWIRELVSNALDSYPANSEIATAASEPREVLLSANNVEGSLTIRDHGVGMSLSEIVFYLLTPSRSANDLLLEPQNAKKDTIGQFGIGFFSCLAMLKEDDDKIIVATKNAQGPSYELTLQKKTDQIWLTFNETAVATSGTAINVVSSSLKYRAAGLADLVVRKYFSFNQKAIIKINGTKVNDSSFFTQRRFPFGDYPHGKYLSYYVSNLERAGSTTQLLLNGVCIEEFNFDQHNAESLVALEQPAIQLTSDRSAIDRQCVETKEALKSWAKHALYNSEVRLFNAIYPLLGRQYFGEGLKFEFSLESHFIPAHKDSRLIDKIYVQGVPKTAQAIDPRAFFHSRYVPRINATGPVPIVAGTFKKAGQAAIFLESVGIFVDHQLTPFSRFTKLLLDGLWEIQQQKMGVNKVTRLFEDKATASSSKPWVEIEASVAAQILKAVRAYGYNESDFREKFWPHQTTIARLITPSVLDIQGQDYSEATETVLQYLFFQVHNTYKNLNSTLAFLEELRDDKNLLEISASNLQQSLKIIFTPFNCFNDHNRRNAKWTMAHAFDSYTMEEKLSKYATVFLTRYRSFFESLLSLAKSYPKEKQREFEFKITDCLTFHIRTEEKLDLFEKMLMHARNFKMPHPEKWIVKNYDEWSLIFPDLSAVLDASLVNNYFAYKNADDYYADEDSHWTPFLKKIIAGSKHNIATIPIPILMDLRQLIECLSSNTYYYKVDASIRVNCPDILLEMIDHLVVDEQLANDLHRFVLSEKERDKVIWQSIKSNNWRLSLDMLFAHLCPYASIELCTWLYRILFSDSTTFFAKNVPFGGDLSHVVTKAVHEHPIVQEILGINEDVIARQYLMAARQNLVLKHSWINEVIKNAHEAGATEISFVVNTDLLDQLVVEVNDNGEGIKAREMHRLFVPGFTLKTGREDDINFGIGFFSLFSFFDEAGVTSSSDGLTLAQICLEKNQDTSRFFLSEQVTHCEDCHKGTRLFLRKKKPSSHADPVEIKANLMRYAGAFNNLAISFNGEPLAGFKIDLADESEALAKVTFSPRQEVHILPSCQSGIFYNGLLLNPSIAKYTNVLPEQAAQAVKLLSHTFAINFVGAFKQNMGRNDFVEESGHSDQLNSLFEGAVWTALVRAGAREPEVLKFMLPYDYFDRLVQQDIPGLDHIPLDKTGGESLFSLRSGIIDYLVSAGVLSTDGNYYEKGQLTLGELEKAFPSAPKPLVEKFENEIVKHMQKIKRQKKAVGSLNSIADTALHKLNFDDIYYFKKATLEAFENTCKKLAREFLNEQIRISYYQAADGSEAHSFQGQAGVRYISFNLQGMTLIEFGTALYDPIKWPQMLQNIVMDLTHELVHTYEAENEDTHNRKFFKRQAKFLQPFFRLRDDEVEALRARALQ
jgi:hypothetical protein